MDDGEGSRLPGSRRAPAGHDPGLYVILVRVGAAVAVAVAVLVVALATPPASADEGSGTRATPAQIGRADPTAPVSSAERAGTGDSRALAWWMAGEVGVLVVGGAIWCRRSDRRKAGRRQVVPVDATGTAGAARALRMTRADRPGAEPGGERSSPRIRL